MRFLLRHQAVEPGKQRAGLRGVVQTIEQLQGFEVAAVLWESHVLAARVTDYRREWLDNLCLSGEVSWGRVSVPTSAQDQAKFTQPQNLPPPLPSRALQPSRVTPITLALRTDLPWLIAAARGANKTPVLAQDTERVLSELSSAGALFFSQLVARTGLPDAAVREALWEGVARGLVSADGFDALRNLLAPAVASAAVFPFVRRSALRHGARVLPQGEGRWSLLTAALDSAERDELCDAVAEQWIARWGVVFYELSLGESCQIPWRELVYALRRLEARGIIRGGRFVTGFAGEQYAAPEAVEALRALRREPRTGQRVVISGCDPLNLTGVLFSGQRVPSLRTQSVVYCDGLPVATPAAELSDGAETG
jgi:ATP-dependent Lhr-like helicase